MLEEEVKPIRIRSLNDLSMEDALAVRVIYDPEAVQRIAGKDPAEFSAFVSGFDQYLAGLRARAQAIANPQQLSDLSEDRVNSLKATYPAGDVEKIAQYDSAKFIDFMKQFDGYLAKAQGQTTETTSYGRLLDTAAQQLRSVGLFEVELSEGGFAELMEQIIINKTQVEVKGKKKTTTRINELNIKIRDGMGQVAIDLNVGKRKDRRPDTYFNGSFRLQNSYDKLGLTGSLIAGRRMGIYTSMASLTQIVEGFKINDLVKDTTNNEMQKRGAGIIRMGLTFTPQNILRMAAFGGKLGPSAAA